MTQAHRGGEREKGTIKDTLFIRLYLMSEEKTCSMFDVCSEGLPMRANHFDVRAASDRGVTLATSTMMLFFRKSLRMALRGLL